MTIDCDRCTVRGIACGNCAVTFIANDKVELDAAEVRALAALAGAGMIPPLRYAPLMAKASLPPGKIPGRSLGQPVLPRLRTACHSQAPPGSGRVPSDR